MIKRMILAVALVSALTSTAALQSCSSDQSTQTTVSKTESGRTTTDNSSATTPSSTTTTTTTTSDEPDSVLGATLHAVGTIVLFPFRLIGDALGLLF